MKDIAVVGTGGLGREIACLINIINENKKIWNLIGFFNNGEGKGTTNEYGEILGGNDDLNSWNKRLSIVIAIGSTSIMHKVTTIIQNPNLEFPNLIAPDLLYLDKDSLSLGIGNIFQTRCALSCNVQIGNFNIFNGEISIGHDTKIGSCNIFMPAVKVSGGVTMGDRNFMGVSSVVLQNLTIGNDIRLGAGSVLIRKAVDNNLYIGNPAIKMNF